MGRHISELGATGLPKSVQPLCGKQERVFILAGESDDKMMLRRIFLTKISKRLRCKRCNLNMAFLAV